ncbi:hypothetical protein KAH55_12860, partial [bacterium]|nr:hypothetical protein [bacterium]
MMLKRIPVLMCATAAILINAAPIAASAAMTDATDAAPEKELAVPADMTEATDAEPVDEEAADKEF